VGSGARTPEPPEAVIAAALSAEHAALWETSGLFRSSVESLAELLVPMVQGLADAARSAEPARTVERKRPVTLLGRLAERSPARPGGDDGPPLPRDDDAP